MGHVYHRVELAAVHEEELTILVDTGATYSLIAPALADRFGVSRLPRKQTVVLADWHEPLLGVEALEASWPGSRPDDRLAETDAGLHGSSRGHPVGPHRTQAANTR